MERGEDLAERGEDLAERGEDLVERGVELARLILLNLLVRFLTLLGMFC
jgi:hypothetical protein